MNRYPISYYKTENLTPDERNAMRANQTGIWLFGDYYTAETPRKAIAAARADLGHKASKFRVETSMLK